MVTPRPTQIGHLDLDWADGIEEKYSYRNLCAEELRLTAGLIFFGGERVLIPSVEEDLNKILERGVLLDGKTVKLMKGLPSQCHQNSALCWMANQDKTLLMTGYGLSDDALWRQHSWVIWIKKSGVQIIETTEPRRAYFGFVLTEQEATVFCELNTDMRYSSPQISRPRMRG